MEEVLVLVRRAGLTKSEVWVLPMLVDDLVATGELARATGLAIDAFELIGDDIRSAATVINLMAGVHLAVALGEHDAAALALGPIRTSVAPILADRAPVPPRAPRRRGGRASSTPSARASTSCSGPAPPSIPRRRSNRS